LAAKWVKLCLIPEAGVTDLRQARVLYEELFQTSKLLLAEEDDERTPEVLLRRIVERRGAVNAGFKKPGT
jgi:hypothetical protein